MKKNILILSFIVFSSLSVTSNAHADLLTDIVKSTCIAGAIGIIATDPLLGSVIATTCSEVIK